MEKVNYRFFKLFSGSNSEGNKPLKYIIVSEYADGYITQEGFNISNEKEFIKRMKSIYPDKKMVDTDGNEVIVVDDRAKILKAYFNEDTFNRNGYYKELSNQRDFHMFYNQNFSYQNAVRNEWLKNNHIYDEYKDLSTSKDDNHKNLYKFIENIYGLNTSLMLDNLAYRLGEFKKQKVLFMIGSEKRNIGKGMFLDLITRTFLCNADERDSINNTRLCKMNKADKFVNVSGNTIVLNINEDFLDYDCMRDKVKTFDWIKELQGIDGGNVEAKGIQPKTIKAPLLMTFNTFNVDVKKLTDKFVVSEDPSYKSYIFYTNNKDADNSIELFMSEEWEIFMKEEAPYILCKHLLARYTDMKYYHKDRLATVSDALKLCKESKYDINELDFETFKKSNTTLVNNLNAILYRYAITEDIDEFRMMINSIIPEYNVEECYKDQSVPGILYYKEWKYIKDFIEENKFICASYNKKNIFGKCGWQDKLRLTKDEALELIKSSKYNTLSYNNLFHNNEEDIDGDISSKIIDNHSIDTIF